MIDRVNLLCARGGTEDVGGSGRRGMEGVEAEKEGDG